MTIPTELDKFETLVAIIARLRAPGGCPWDREQTHSSLREHLLEECYEALEALDRQNTGELCEELGDLLLQIVLHARIAEEAGEFDLDDVIQALNTKLINRHPHVFGDVKVKDSGEVLRNWEAIKQTEREENISMLDGVSRQLPALAYAQSVQQRVAQVGFDWKDISGVMDKLAEEVAEFKEAEGQERKAQEFGDVLFTLVNIARRMGVNSEAALREANQRFYQRFSYMEAVCRKRGVKIGDLSFDEQNTLWEEAKKHGKVLP